MRLREEGGGGRGPQPDSAVAVLMVQAIAWPDMSRGRSRGGSRGGSRCGHAVVTRQVTRLLESALRDGGDDSDGGAGGGDAVGAGLRLTVTRGGR